MFDQRIQSMTEFKQIIGRGTRIKRRLRCSGSPSWDFKKATELLPIRPLMAIRVVPGDDPPEPPPKNRDEEQNPPGEGDEL